jgi:hypothetical protein
MPLFDRVRRLNLPDGHFAIFGSGPLIVRGLIPASNDLDILCRGPAWDYIQGLGEPEFLAEYDLSIVTLFDKSLTFGNLWGIGEFDTDELIDEAEMIDGLPFVRLEHVARYKRISKRPKDLAHLEVMRKSCAMR